jgi:hypothetical protein
VHVAAVGDVHLMKPFRNFVSSSNKRTTPFHSYPFTRPQSAAPTNFLTTIMPSYERVAIQRNTKYTHNGTKSYVFAMSKCKLVFIEEQISRRASILTRYQMALTPPSLDHTSTRSSSSRKGSSALLVAV